MIVELKQKSQVTIPAEFARKLKLGTGDKLEVEIVDGGLVLTPVVVVPRDQAWFYTKAWQTDELVAEEQIKYEKVTDCNNTDELFVELGIDEL